MRRCSAAILLTAASLSCAQIPKTEPYTPGVGIQTCRRLAKAAVNRSTEEFLTGTAIAMIGAVGVGAAIAMGPDERPDAAWYERSRHLLVIVPTAIVTGIGVNLFTRAQATETLADQSSAAIAEANNEADEFLYFQCVSARGDWSGDRSELSRYQIKLLKENLATAMAAQQNVTLAATQAHVATKVAVEARSTAVKAEQIASASAEAIQNLVGVSEKLVEGDPRKKDGGTAIDAGPALSAAKANLEPRPDAGAPRLDKAPPTSTPLDQH